MKRLPLIVGWLSLWLLTMGSGLENRQVVPTGRPHIPAIKVNSPPKIDGDLNDAAWKIAAKVTGFWRTDRDQLAQEQTEVLICYDDMPFMLLSFATTLSLILFEPNKERGEERFKVMISSPLILIPLISPSLEAEPSTPSWSTHWEHKMNGFLVGLRKSLSGEGTGRLKQKSPSQDGQWR